MKRLALTLLFLGAPSLAQDLQNGRDVYGPCAACHGASGEGGKGGEYPRLAGQPASYLIDQLKLFQGRKRKNLPMFPYTEPRELSQADMKDVAAYLTVIELPRKCETTPVVRCAQRQLPTSTTPLEVGNSASCTARSSRG